MHLAGYRLAETIDDLTCDQEAFVGHVAFEMTKLKAKIAGAEIKDSPRQNPGEDSYGKLLERGNYRDLQAKFAERLRQSANKPL